MNLTRTDGEWRDAMEARLRRKRPDVPDAREKVQEVERRLVEIAEILHRYHGTPDLGNQEDPLDELVYIILSRRTREDAYREAFGNLKSRYDSWEAVANAPVEEIETTIAVSGLAGRKASSIKAFLGSIHEQLGHYSLESLRDWNDEQALDFLDGLPGVGVKSALCVMLYSLHRPVFPVDAHVGRVLARLGVLEPLGIRLLEMEHRPRQTALREAVPPHLRYGLHVNLVVHGRFPCRSIRPVCESCPLLRYCARRGLE